MGETHTDTTLVDALRALQRATDELSRRKARSRLADVVSTSVFLLVHKRIADKDRAKEVAQDAVVAIVLDKPHLCRAPLLPDFERAERAAWAWVVALVRRRIYDSMERLTNEQRTHAGEDALEQVYAPEQEPPSPLEQLLTQAEDGARELIETRQPKSLYEAARKSGVASKEEGVARDIDSWRQVKVFGRRCLDVGMDRGAEGPDGRLQNQISKQVERGKKALHYGALVAAARAKSPDERALLERFAQGLLKTEKK
jgi:DNA-directed RNA polymerase specialized sigma24 family protein